MKVILLKNVDKVGKAGEVVNVADGFFRNLLAPKHLAKVATPAAEREAATIRARAAEEAQKSLTEAAALLERAKTETFVVQKKANDEGHLFGSVTEQDILEAMRRNGYKDVQEQHVHIEAPIKTLGAHNVTLRFSPELEGVIAVTVEKSD